jgi:hypothetical protein
MLRGSKENRMLNYVADMGAGAAGLLEKGILDVPANQLCDQSKGLANHPIWQIGHVTIAQTFLARQLGAECELPEAWIPLFSRGSTPVSDASKYPSRETLLERFRATQPVIAGALKSCDAAKLAGPHSIEPLKNVFPSLGHLAVGVMVMHNALHLGQLSAWRHAMGLPRLIG